MAKIMELLFYMIILLQMIYLVKILIYFYCTLHLCQSIVPLVSVPCCCVSSVSGFWSHVWVCFCSQGFHNLWKIREVASSVLMSY